ncbi:unnamed protein product [Rotaria socialis]|uniref:Uncharacterized protein n=1 Tax=Rotaria socialis TaxID=392032 RepID=A0A820AA19_9BILA|nr:unnamed protein product [Rotaria socialis]CAF4188476.1 unnamed protein product [Rotaria socialis]
MKMFLSILCTISTFSLLITANNVGDHLRKESATIASSSSNIGLPRGTVVMVASSEMDHWFNINGKGLGEYSGWYICDGRNGTPDLRGRFLVGRDALNSGSSYSQIAQTSAAGAHAHYYHDITYADGCDIVVPTYRGIRSGTPNNKACQIGRTTAAAGQHDHSISVSTSRVGSSAPQENRPPYYVVAYIIYIGV